MHLVFRIEGRHPHKATPAPGHLGHVFHRRGIDATHGQIQVDAAEYLDSRHRVPHHEGKTRSILVVILEHDGAHPARAGLLGFVDRVERTRTAVGQGMHMDIDRAAQHGCGSTALAGVRCNCGGPGIHCEQADGGECEQGRFR